MILVKCWEYEEMGTQCLMGIEFQLYKMTRLRKMDGAGSCMNGVSILNAIGLYIFNGQDSKWYAICILLQF